MPATSFQTPYSGLRACEHIERSAASIDVFVFTEVVGVAKFVEITVRVVVCVVVVISGTVLVTVVGVDVA